MTITTDMKAVIIQAIAEGAVTELLLYFDDAEVVLNIKSGDHIVKYAVSGDKVVSAIHRMRSSQLLSVAEFNEKIDAMLGEVDPPAAETVPFQHKNAPMKWERPKPKMHSGFSDKDER